MYRLYLDVPARIHISLIDMSQLGYRRHGGIGFALRDGFRCEAFVSTRTKVVDCRPVSAENRAQCALIQEKLEDLRTILLLQPIEFVICSGFDAHAGFGSGTALSLAAIESLHLLNKVSYSESDIVSASGRGGVSGIGIRTYFAGGLWVDAGVPNGGATFRSSDQFHEVNRQSTSLMRVAMPEWVVGICIPSAVSLTPREIEDSFFAAFPGASEGEVESLAYQIFMGLIPAVVEGDNETFSIALDRVQTTYWKRAERSLHSSVKPIESVLRSLGAKGIGLSSIGPGLFFLDPGEERVRSILGDGLVEARTIVARPSNEGRRLTHA